MGEQPLFPSRRLWSLLTSYCRSSYHGYWAEDIWALNSAFGTEADLAELSSALHARGMVSAYARCDVST